MNVRYIDLDFHQDDIELFADLVAKYHPGGVRIPTGFLLSFELENPMMEFQFPKALVEWAYEMDNKYKDKEFALTLIKRILEKLGIIRSDANDASTPAYSSIN